MAFPSLSPADLTDATARPPELNDADYVREVVLGCTNNNSNEEEQKKTTTTEADIDAALAALAAGLGIDLPLPTRLSSSSARGVPNPSDSESANTIVSLHGRTASTSSNDTTATGLTSQTSRRSTGVIPATLTESTNAPTSSRRRSKSLSFSQYEKYLSQVSPTAAAARQPKFLNPPPTRPEWPVGPLIGTGRRKSVRDLKRTIAGKLRRRRQIPSLALVACVCCREDFVQDHHDLRTLLCGHTYCQQCLAVMLTQSTTDESKMPPRCCTQPIPGGIIKTVLNRDDQQKFLKAVLQFSTPWEARIFCPNTSCGEFIPPRSKIDPKHPFEAICRNCKTRVCVTCKRNAHRLGQDCPEDWELDAVLKIGEKSGWRRCYKCRTLVELTQGCTHMTCRCKAQFCYICGAVWDPAVGCPNFCNGEEELERRRMEEEARLAELEAEKKASEEAAAAEELAQQEALKRSRESEEYKGLLDRQEAGIRRFREFERQMKANMRARQSKQRVALREKFLELSVKMEERHGKTEQHLDDRQIQAEIDLMTALEQSKKSINIQLKYMEAYCNPPRDTNKKNSITTAAPLREVTQKHLDQLDQQYRIRDGMERRHQSQVNVLREKQAKRMEELMERHKKEMAMLAERSLEEMEGMEVGFTDEEEALVRVFAERKGRLRRRGEVESEILRVELERRTGMRFTALRAVWPGEGEGEGEGEREGDDGVEGMGEVSETEGGMMTVVEE